MGGYVGGQMIWVFDWGGGGGDWGSGTPDMLAVWGTDGHTLVDSGIGVP